jgi:hypothetical protein
MKKNIRTALLKFLIKKRMMLINASVFIILMTFLTLGCIKEDYPVRLVFPVLTTAPISDTTSSSAVTGGNITSNGGKEVTARGVCWSVSINPSIFFTDSITVDGTGSGEFTSTIDGLLANKTYHVRAYATNPDGTTYGQDLSFKTKTAGP